METRLYSIFKSKNTMKLTKPIIESSYKALQLDKIWLVTIKRPVNFLPVVEFLTTFNLLNWYKVCKIIGILYRTRCILNKFLRKQLYFSFINCYLNYANIAWASTNKSKLQALYRHQKHAARIINFKDKFTSAKPLLEQINAMTVYEMNIFQTLCFMYLCKNGNTPSIFNHIYTLKPINKYTARSINA